MRPLFHDLSARLPARLPARSPAITAMILLASAGLAACEDVDSPAELDHPQVLAVQASPAQVPAGGSAELDVLVAGPDGDIQPGELRWSVSAPGVASGLGEIVFQDPSDGSGDLGPGWHYRAPESLPGDPVMVTLAVDIELPDGLDFQTLAAEKILMVGMDSVPAPEVTGLTMDGASIDERMALPSGDRVELSLEVDSATPGGLTTWHATCGILEQYRESIAIFEAPAEPCQGVLYAVHRDELGGVVWHRVGILVGEE